MSDRLYEGDRREATEKSVAFLFGIISPEEGMVATFNSLVFGSLGERVPMFGNSDPMGLSKFFSGAFQSFEAFRQGLIITYNPGTHTAAVLVSGSQKVWTCFFADEALSYSYGYSATNPAKDGETVLVMQIAPGIEAGVIVGRIPYPLCFVNGDKYNDPDQYHRRLFTMDEQAKQTWDRHINGIMKPLENINDNSSGIRTHFRPTDVYPGEFAHVNQHNCGIKGGMFSTTLIGGGASLRLSALSNLARIACESFQRYSLSGALHEFHNGRYLSSERNFALYQEERLGWHKPDYGNFSSNVWTTDSEAPKGGENQTMRPRIKELGGFFGHLKSSFCLRPDPNDEGLRVQGSGSPKEAGVSRETIDPSGQYRLSTAGMLVLERTGRIPVPVRKCYPTDDKHQIDETPEVLKPFKHKEDDPGNRQLELFDRQAYDLKNQYARVDGLGFTPDYDVPQETDLKPLEDEYDKKYFGNKTVKLQKYDKRRAGVYIGEDGSVIIRDAWGSEITMLGGNVQISCAGNIMTMPGKTALTIAGDDIVQKAQNSVDIHASEHDVRLSAARNMEIRGGGDEKKYPGGVIIESVGSSPSPWDGKDKGEDARLSGITLRTKNQAVVVDGKIVNVRSKTDTRIISGDKKLDGTISLAAKFVRSRAKSNIFASSAGKAHLIVNGRSVQAVADNIALLATKSLLPIQGMKYPIPMKWETVGAIPAEVMPSIEEATEDLQEENTAAQPFDRKALDKMIFGFRKSIECSTDQPWVIGASGRFRLYEPAWVQVMNVYETLKKGGVDAKVYEEEAEWDNGKPFPGKEAEDSAEYAQLSGLKPKNLTDEGFNKSRKSVEDSSSIETPPLKDSYRIRK